MNTRIVLKRKCWGDDGKKYYHPEKQTMFGKWEPAHDFLSGTSNTPASYDSLLKANEAFTRYRLPTCAEYDRVIIDESVPLPAYYYDLGGDTMFGWGIVGVIFMFVFAIGITALCNYTDHHTDAEIRHAVRNLFQ